MSTTHLLSLAPYAFFLFLCRGTFSPLLPPPNRHIYYSKGCVGRYRNREPAFRTAFAAFRGQLPLYCSRAAFSVCFPSPLFV